MIRTAIGAALGGAIGFGVMIAAEYLTSPAGLGAGGNHVAVVAVLAATGGATVGAVVGGVADLLAFLHRALPPRATGAESDYGDRPPR
jgi:hypothetical protein